MPSSIPRVIRFGVFEVDLQEAELRKSGVRIKLQEQPFQILIMLLEHPGRTVTREELRQRLWPADTFVDFDHSLNSSIKKLREALGDDSENPRFIETLHRRGYRFIAPVCGQFAANGQNEQGLTEPAQPVVASRVDWKRSLRRWRWAVIAVLVVGALLLALWLRSPLPPPRIVSSQELTNDGLLKDSLVTDGSRIYFSENFGQYSRIAQVSVGGGETAVVDVPIPRPSIEDISTQQSELLIAEWTPEMGNYQWTMWSMPLPAGSLRLISNVNGHDAVWTPRGKLVFAVGNDLYIADHYGAKPSKFATAPGFPASISFSPDGNRFRFTAKNLADNTSALWEARADGSDMHPLFPGWNNPPAECCGHWARDGKYYVFQSTRDGATNIWIVREHSPWWRKAWREPVQLTVGPLQLSNPLPSADGKKLFAIGTRKRAELVRYDAKSGEFVPYLGGISAGDVDFSRDGKWVTYVSYPDYTLWRSKPDGSARLQLTYAPMRTGLAHWSPDGKQIAFSGAVPGKPWKVFLISRDGGDPQAVTADEFTETDPTWSADGKALAFGHFDPLHADKTFIELFNIATHQISELPGSRQIFAPRWSPDGRYIIALSHRSDRLMLYDVKNEKWRQADVNPQFGYGYLSWSRDSAYVYFDTASAEGSGYYRLRISDSKLEKVSDFRNIRLFVSDPLLGTWTGLGPDDTPLLPRDISTQEIYALDLELP